MHRIFLDSIIIKILIHFRSNDEEKKQESERKREREKKERDYDLIFFVYIFAIHIFRYIILEKKKPSVYFAESYL